MKHTLILVLCLTVISCDDKNTPEDDTTTTDTTTPDAIEDSTSPDTDVVEEMECAVDTDCDDDDSCTTDTCDTWGDCHNDLLDEDDDGYIAESCGGDDCDDARDDVHPNADEDSCYDGLDQGCDGTVGPISMGCHSLVSDATLRHPQLTWTGSEYGTIWQMPDFVVVSRFTAEGTAIGTPVSRLGAVGRIAWSGSLFGVTYAQGTSLHFDTISADGALLTSDLVLGTGSEPRGQVIWTGSLFAFMWYTYAFPNPDLMLSRVDGSGAQIGSAITALTGSDEVGEDPIPIDLLWTGSEYAYAAIHSTTIFEVYRIDGTGSFLDSFEMEAL